MTRCSRLTCGGDLICGVNHHILYLRWATPVIERWSTLVATITSLGKKRPHNFTTIKFAQKTRKLYTSKKQEYQRDIIRALQGTNFLLTYKIRLGRIKIIDSRCCHDMTYFSWLPSWTSWLKIYRREIWAPQITEPSCFHILKRNIWYYTNPSILSSTTFHLLQRKTTVWFCKSDTEIEASSTRQDTCSTKGITKWNGSTCVGYASALPSRTNKTG